MATAASQLTCYLLQLVHEIVCEARTYNSGSIGTADVSAVSAANGDTPHSDNDTDTDIDAKMPAVSGRRTSSGQPRRGRQQPDRFAAEMDVLNSADITAIVALREFLTHGIGGRILEALMLIDTNVRES